MTDAFRLLIVLRPGIDPLDRQWFEEHLTEAFVEDGLGVVVGGGGALDGSMSDIAIDVNDSNRGLAVVRDVLRREQAPRGTQIIEQGVDLRTHEVYDDLHPHVEPVVPAEQVASGDLAPRSPALPQLGDAYLVPLNKGLFGACRVIGVAKGEYATLVAGTDWFGAAPPPLSEPTLRSLLVHTCWGAIGPSCTYWLTGKPPAEFVHLGYIAPSPEEQRIRIGDYTDHWSFIANSLRVQWEWLQKQK